ncbi:MAG TPA: TetR/AcrR family transcriptional regulator [Acidimicrobiales bacterium]|nr:TetR/AcrR family transcriptional regulator [Acidimicrobiales bacterium]
MTSNAPARTPSRWNGLSAEERQRERRRLLIDAAYDLLASEGSSGTTVRAVCARARLNPRYFYESFTDLDELVVAVYDDVFRDLQRRLGQAVAEAEDDDDAMRASVDATVRFVDEDRRRGRILYVEAIGNEALNVRRIRAGAGQVELVERDHARREGQRYDPRVGTLGAAVLVGGFTELLVAWLDGRVQLSTDELIADATQVFLAVRDATRDLYGSGSSTTGG